MRLITGGWRSCAKNLLRLWCSPRPSADKTQLLPPRGVAYPFAPPSGSFVGNDRNTRKNDKLSHLPAFRRRLRRESQPGGDPGAGQYNRPHQSRSKRLSGRRSPYSDQSSELDQRRQGSQIPVREKERKLLRLPGEGKQNGDKIDDKIYRASVTGYVQSVLYVRVGRR